MSILFHTLKMSKLYLEVVQRFRFTKLFNNIKIDPFPKKLGSFDVPLLHTNMTGERKENTTLTFTRV